MKTLITLITMIALLASVSVSAFTMNKDWGWNTEINQNGVFSAVTPAINATGTFSVIAVPEDGVCNVRFAWGTSVQVTSDFKPNVALTGIDVRFAVDNKKGWDAKTESFVTTQDGYSHYQSTIDPDNGDVTILELLKGSKMQAQLIIDGEADQLKQYSLMGSSVAMKAVYASCKKHIAAFPDYDSSTDSRAAMEWKMQEKAQQTVADKAAAI